jgi:lantibiotic modifying enzyme
MTWQTLLDGASNVSASESVQAILDDLETRGREPSGDFSLAGGSAGLAVLHGYLAQSERGHESDALARRCLQHAAAAVSERPGTASLYGGLTGVGWAMAHLRSRLPDVDREDDLGEIDEVLLDHLDQSPWRGEFDLIEGLVGFGVYALERLHRPAATACLERVVDRLAETAEHQGEGITWWTDPAWLPSETRAEFSGGYYNLGLAHGVPGVIGLLGQVCAAGVAHDEARPLLDGAGRWLLDQDGPDGFSYWVVPGTKGNRARLAWCYGDPGVAAALLGAASHVEESAWESAALAIARRAAERPYEESGIKDAGLCHGSAGLAHLFNRMFQATGEPRLAEAARSWFEQTLAMRRPGRGIGGYEAWEPDGARSADRGLLTGATGIALALLAATTDIEPLWDRMLLVSITPRSASLRRIHDERTGGP